MQTPHTCGGPAWGRKTPGCPRCDELAAGAKPKQGWGQRAKDEERRRIAAIRAHDCKASRCNIVCTAFDW